MNRRTLRPVAAVSAVVVSTALLAGCAESLPQPQAGEPFDGPALSVDQDTAVFESVATTLEAAGKKTDPDALKPRVTGPAYEVRSSQLKVAKTLDDDSLVTDIPSDSQQMIIPTTTTWPRTSYSITQATKDLETPRLVAFEQSEARSQYKMWGWVQLVPGVQMPVFADTGIGSEAVASDDDSLVMTPADAMAQYADVVALGTEKSSFAKNFDLPDNDLASLVANDAKNIQGADGFDEADGKYSVKFAARKDDVRAVRTADGGALVLGALDGSATTTAEEGAKIAPHTQTEGALFGDQEQTNKLKVTYTDMAALYIPAADSGDKVRALGYSHVATAASN